MKLMHKLTVVGAAVLLLVASIFSSSNYAAAADSSYYFGFETADGVAPFMPMANGVAKLPGLSLQRVTGENGCPSLHGDAYARLKISRFTDAMPPPRPGTWIDASVPGKGINQVTIDFAAKSIDGTAEAAPIVYVGPDMPIFTEQFAELQTTLVKTWQHFRFSTRVATETAESIFFAIGWAGDTGSIGIDCISVNIQPVTVGPSPGGGSISLDSGK